MREREQVNQQKVLCVCVYVGGINTKYLEQIHDPSHALTRGGVLIPFTVLPRQPGQQLRVFPIVHTTACIYIYICHASCLDDTQQQREKV